MMSARRNLGNQTFKFISGIPPSGMVGWLLPALLVDHKPFPIVSHITTGTSFTPAYLPTSDALSLSQCEEYTTLAAKALSVTKDVAEDHSTTLSVNPLRATEDNIPHHLTHDGKKEESSSVITSPFLTQVHTVTRPICPTSDRGLAVGLVCEDGQRLDLIVRHGTICIAAHSFQLDGIFSQLRRKATSSPQG